MFGVPNFLFFIIPFWNSVRFRKFVTSLTFGKLVIYVLNSPPSCPIAGYIKIEQCKKGDL